MSTDDHNWADYVFEEDYCLKSLEEVEDFISINKHLPDIPSADEVAKCGIDVLEMDSKLLAKIEELTLYLIEMKKENDKLKERMEVLEKDK
jgi:predicted nuclease with TOPRIM domain